MCHALWVGIRCGSAFMPTSASQTTAADRQGSVARYAAIPMGQRVPFFIAVVEFDVIDTACAHPRRIMTNIVEVAEGARFSGSPVVVVRERMGETLSVPRR